MTTQDRCVRPTLYRRPLGLRVEPAANAPTRRPGGLRYTGLVHARGFTLVEITVVIIIIALLAAIVLPSVNSMWRQRNVSTAENMVKGALESARAAALRRGDRGLFFYLDDGVQKMAPIQADPIDLSFIDNPPTIPAVDLDGNGMPDDQDNMVTRPVASLRFRISDGPILTVPAPLRVCPRVVVDTDDDNNPMTNPPAQTLLWSDLELSNDDYQAAALTDAQKQRNFFTLVFDRDGRLSIDRDIVIHDLDRDNNGFGDRTKLRVDKATDYYPLTGSAAGAATPFESLPGAASGVVMDDLVVDSAGVALNFPGADGLLVYDDDAFRQFPPPPSIERRKFVQERSQPYYVGRLGEIIPGPVGE